MRRDLPYSLTGAAARLRGTRLVGREPELAALIEALDTAIGGRATTVVLIGEPGMGKSRLRAEVQRLATEHGMTVLAGRAVERSRAEPFHPWAEALSRGFADAGPPRDAVLLPLLPALGRLVPAWSPAPSDTPTVAGVSEAVLRLLDITAGPPGLVLTLEDLHWADAETLAVAEYVAENVGDQPLCLVYTVRSGEPGDAERLARRLGDTRAATVLDLRALDHDSVRELVLDCLGADAAPELLVSWITERADGSPFLVEELLAGLARVGALVPSVGGWQLVSSRMTATVPATLAQSIARRYRDLADRTQDVLSAAALLGRRFDWRHLAGVTGFDEHVVIASLREASAAGLLISDDQHIRFRHSLTCDEIRRLTLAPQRARLAGRAVETLERAAAADIAARSAGSAAVGTGLARNSQWRDTVAELAVIAGQPLRAARHLIVAADDARARGALSSAASYLSRAAELARDTDTGLESGIRERLATVRAYAGDVDGAFALGLESLAAREAHGGDPAGDIDLRLTLARAALAAGRYGDARAQLDLADRRVEEAGGDRLRGAWIKALAAEVAVAAGHLASAERLAAEVLADADTLARTTDRSGVASLPEMRCTAYEVRGRCQRVRDVTEAEKSFLAALETADQHGLLSWRARALHELGTIDLFDTLRVDRLTAARRAAVEAGVPATEAVVDFHLSAVLLSRADTVGGRAAAERSAALARRLGHAVHAPALTMVARSWAQERRTDEMKAALAAARTAAPDDLAVEAAAWSHAHTMLALHEADRDAALTAQNRAAELLAGVPGQHDPHRGLWALLRTLADEDAAQARAAAATSAGSGTRFNRALLRAAAAVDAGRDDARRSAAAAELNSAIAELRGYQAAEWLLHLTYWLVAPAAAADGWGEPVSWLDRAVRWFAGHGYEPLARSSRVLLRDAGGAVPRQGRGLSEVPERLAELGVTSREVDVLRLLGNRLTNREVARKLVVSPRTVEKHVANLMLKTNRPDRASLAGLAAELDLKSP